VLHEWLLEMGSGVGDDVVVARSRLRSGLGAGMREKGRRGGEEKRRGREGGRG
jgi:hypothetical protein